ncbi:MAG: hypothetical protein PVJ49_06300 [Acidobacteriota bacterium]|jgi:hypothetical protein
MSARFTTPPAVSLLVVAALLPAAASPAAGLPTIGRSATQQQRGGYTPTAANAPSTDIWIAELTVRSDVWSIGEPRNVTDRDGYDNQPAFEPGGETMLFTSAREPTQSDVYRYSVANGEIERVTFTLASEYSPTPLPGGDGFSAIHESAEGQLLWRYDLEGESVGSILPQVQPVGYHAWGDPTHVIMFVLGSGDSPATLQLGDLGDDKVSVIAENPGRSLHRVPDRHAVSFVRKLSRNEWWIEVLDLDSMVFTRIGRTLPGREDYAWTPDGAVIMGDGSSLHQMRPGGEWRQIADLSAAGVSGISRLAIADNGTLIAIVADR